MPSWNTPPPSNNEMNSEAREAKAKAQKKFDENRSEEQKAWLGEYGKRMKAVQNRGEQALRKSKQAITEHAGKKGSTKGPNMNPRPKKRRRSRSRNRSMNGGTRKK